MLTLFKGGFMKKKGFTFIELLVAMTIISIGLTSVLALFSSAQATQRRANKKLDLASYGKTIVETFKGNGKAELYKLYSDATIKGTNGDVSFYIFFNDYNELQTIVSDKTKYSIVSSGASGNFAQCKSINSSGGKKRYGAAVLISQDPNNPGNPTYYFKVYSMRVLTWDMNSSDDKLNSELSVHLGR